MRASSSRPAKDASAKVATAPRTLRPRVVLAKPGLDGHNLGAAVVYRGLRDAGCEVIYLGLRTPIDAIVQAAVEEDADVVGLSMLSGVHLQVSERVIAALREAGLTNTAVVVGGIIPDEDRESLRALGVAAVFTPGAKLAQVSEVVNRLTEERRAKEPR